MRLKRLAVGGAWTSSTARTERRLFGAFLDLLGFTVKFERDFNDVTHKEQFVSWYEFILCL